MRPYAAQKTPGACPISTDDDVTNWEFLPDSAEQQTGTTPTGVTYRGQIGPKPITLSEPLLLGIGLNLCP